MAPATQPARVVAADRTGADTLPKIEGMIMENTNDKTAAGAASIERLYINVTLDDGSPNARLLPSASGALVYYSDHVAALEARAEEARREAAEEHKQFRCLVQSMIEACRSAQAERNALRIQLDQRTAGGDAVGYHAGFADGWFSSGEGRNADCGGPSEPGKELDEMAAHAYNEWATRFPVAEAAAQADDEAVDRFADAMKAKMAAGRAKGRGGWDDPEQCQVQDLARMLVEHVEKGDPVDIGNFAMMLWNRKALLKAADEFRKGSI